MRSGRNNFAAALALLLAVIIGTLLCSGAQTAAAVEPDVLTVEQGSSIPFPQIPVSGRVGNNAQVMLLNVPEHLQIENSRRIGSGMWSFPLSALDVVRINVGDGFEDGSKLTAIVYLDGSDRLLERSYVLKVAKEREVVTPPKQPAPVRVAANGDDRFFKLALPLTSKSEEVLSSENVMLLDVPSSVEVEGAERIGEGLWLISPERIDGAALRVKSQAERPSAFKLFTIGAGGDVTTKRRLSIDPEARRLETTELLGAQDSEPEEPVPFGLPSAEQDEEAQTAAASGGESDASAEAPTEAEDNAVVDWRQILERQKREQERDEQQGKSAPAAIEPDKSEPAAAENTKLDDDELLVMGQFLVKECTTCHNVYAKDVGIPVMTGLTVERFMDTIDLYRRGRRSNKVMQSIANSLSETETRALAIYLSRIKPDAANAGEGAAIAPAAPAPEDSEEALLGLAKVLVRECTTCHNLYGTDIGIPVMIGIPVERFESTMDLYRRKKRGNKVMQSVAASLSDRDTHALALYLSRIKPAGPGAAASAELTAASPAQTAVLPSKPVAKRRADAAASKRIAGWIAKGQDLLAEGSVASGRLLLKRAAEYGDARAALALAASYDPNTMRWDPGSGIVAEPIEARRWYLQAKALGAGPEVDRRLSDLPAPER